jgi:hypothetical protein
MRGHLLVPVGGVAALLGRSAVAYERVVERQSHLIGIGAFVVFVVPVAHRRHLRSAPAARLDVGGERTQQWIVGPVEFVGVPVGEHG